MQNNRQNIIIYNTADGKASVSLYTKDSNVWMNQSQLAAPFDTSKQNNAKDKIPQLEKD